MENLQAQAGATLQPPGLPQPVQQPQVVTVPAGSGSDIPPSRSLIVAGRGGGIGWSRTASG
eukprot:15277872-Alexandrium_andersonii.AAC.1